MISVSKLIELYTTPFDKEYYASKRTLLDMIALRIGKKASYTMNSYLKSVTLDEGKEYMMKYIKVQRFENEFETKKNKLLNKWSADYKLKQEKGNKAHSREYGEVVYTKGGTQIYITSFTDGVYIEVGVCSQVYGVVGRIDKLIVQNKKCIIEDLKTSTFTNAPMQDKFKYPIDNLFQTPMNRVRLQLSLYAFILEELGYEIDKLLIKHTEGFGGIYTEVKYLKKEVKLLLNNYKSKQ